MKARTEVFLFAAAALFAAGSLSARSLGFRDDGTDDMLAHRVGEEMCFLVTVVDRDAKNAPVIGQRVKWIMHTDDGVARQGTVLSSEPMRFPVALSKPGFARLELEAVNEKGVREPKSDKFDGSLGADVMKIDADLPPADFDAFWDRQLARMRSVTPRVWTEDVPNKDTNVVVKAFFVTGIPGEGTATGFIGWPRAAKERSLPLDVNVPGYGYGRVDVSSRTILDKGGKLAMVITRYGEDPVASKDYHENLWTNSCAAYGWRNNATLTGNDFFKMVMRDRQALGWAKTLPLWDGRTIHVGGPSMGGYRTVVLAALDPAVTSCSVNFPWFNDVAGSAHQGRIGGWAPEWTRELAYVDAAYLARRVKCPVSLAIGLADFVCPPAGQMLLYRNLAGPVTMTVSQCVGHGWGCGVRQRKVTWSHPAQDVMAGRDCYGAPLGGIALATTGRFRLDDVGGSKCLIDPLGNVFRHLDRPSAARGDVTPLHTPYVEMIPAHSRKLGKLNLRDPFDGSFGECILWEISERRSLAADPWCIGFIVDENPQFGARPEDLALAALESDDTQPAKIEFLRTLAAKGVACDAAKGAKGVPAAELRAFGETIAEEYFKRTRAGVEKLSKGLMYLGPSMTSPWPDWGVAALAAKHCALSPSQCREGFWHHLHEADSIAK